MKSIPYEHWRLSEGIADNVSTIYIRNGHIVLFSSSRTADKFTDNWYKYTRKMGQKICDLLNAEIEAEDLRKDK